MRLKQRLNRLKQADGLADACPSVKAWLGWPLTAAEQREVEADAGVEPDWDAVDTSDWTADERDWLL